MTDDRRDSRMFMDKLLEYFYTQIKSLVLTLTANILGTIKEMEGILCIIVILPLP